MRRKCSRQRPVDCMPNNVQLELSKLRSVSRLVATKSSVITRIKGRRERRAREPASKKKERRRIRRRRIVRSAFAFEAD